MRSKAAQNGREQKAKGPPAKASCEILVEVLPPSVDAAASLALVFSRRGESPLYVRCCCYKGYASLLPLFEPAVSNRPAGAGADEPPARPPPATQPAPARVGVW